MAQTVNLESTQSLEMQNSLQSLAVANGLSTPTINTVLLGIVNQKINLIATAKAIDDCFLLAAIISIAALFMCFFLKDVKT
jgi:hypothetical protein